jgi:uncharacterized membrane protein
MKHVKVLSLAAVTAAVLMAFVGAGTASATTLTGEGGAVLKTGTTIHANFAATEKVPKAVLTTSFKNIECAKSTVSGKTTNETGTTVNINVEALTFEECNCEVKVLKTGTLAVASSSSLTSSGAEVTATCSTLFGNVHCIYATNGPWATLTGSRSLNNSTARLDITVEFPRLTTSSLCDQTATWHIEFSIDNPDWLDVSN